MVGKKRNNLVIPDLVDKRIGKLPVLLRVAYLVA